MTSIGTFLFLIIILLLGTSTIAFQLLFERLIQLTVGGTIASSFLITYATLVGMGLGAYIVMLPKAQSKTSLPLLLVLDAIYVLFCAICAQPLLRHIFALTLLQNIPSDLTYLALYTVTILLFLPPAMIAGAIIPILMRYVGQNIYTSAAFFYGLYTLGSAVGIYTLIRIFLPLIPIHANLYLISFIFMMSAWLLRFVAIPKPHANTEPKAPDTHLPSRDWKTMATTSAMVMIFESAIIRAAVTHIGPDNAYAFPFALLTYLASYSIGSMILAPMYRMFRATLFPILLLLPVAFGVTLLISKTIPNQGLISLFFISGFQHTAPVALMAGMIFPLLLGTGKHLEQKSSILSLAQAIGTMFGGILYIGLGVPTLGTQTTITIAVLVYYYVILLIYTRGWRLQIRAAAYITTLYLLFLTIDHTYWHRWIHKDTKIQTQVAEGRGGAAWIEWIDATKAEGPLYINGTVASYFPYASSHSLLAALSAGAPHKEDVLVLGLGNGGLVRDILTFPMVQSVDIVEWSRENIALMTNANVSAKLSSWPQDERVSIIPADIRSYIPVAKYKHRTYSLIVDNLTVIGWSGSTAVRSTEFFQSIMDILSTNGVYIVILHHNFDRQLLAAFSSLTNVCPYVSYMTEPKTNFAICSRSKPSWDIAFMNKIAEQMSTRPHHAPLFSTDTWFTNALNETNKSQYQNIEPISDNLPYFEYEEFSVIKRYQ